MATFHDSTSTSKDNHRFLCDQCSKSFLQNATLNRHLKVHNLKPQLFDDTLLNVKILWRDQIDEKPFLS